MFWWFVSDEAENHDNCKSICIQLHRSADQLSFYLFSITFNVNRTQKIDKIVILQAKQIGTIATGLSKWMYVCLVPENFCMFEYNKIQFIENTTEKTIISPNTVHPYVDIVRCSSNKIVFVLWSMALVFVLASVPHTANHHSLLLHSLPTNPM